ncbi:MAG: mucin-associated surface protein [Jatrophihabitans sp.]|nr:mucin-associated surface protein [Jatrophihabitans sp.]
MVTAELAACLPVLVLLLAVALSAVSVADVRVRAADAASEAARLAARGDTAAARRVAAGELPGASLSLRISGDQVVAVVTAHARLLASWLPSVTVVGRAVAAREPP